MPWAVWQPLQRSVSPHPQCWNIGREGLIHRHPANCHEISSKVCTIHPLWTSCCPELRRIGGTEINSSCYQSKLVFQFQNSAELFFFHLFSFFIASDCLLDPRSRGFCKKILHNYPFAFTAIVSSARIQMKAAALPYRHATTQPGHL